MLVSEASRRPSRLEAIDALRGFAAMLVVVGHILDDAPQFNVELLAPLAGLPIWQAGVDIFFVISGFVMIWTFGNRFGAEGAPADFAKRRLARIVPLYWLVTSITAAAAILAPSLCDRRVCEPAHFILSLLFVPHQAPGGGLWPILGVGWTLNYEMLFYAVFAVSLFFRAKIGLTIIFLSLVIACLVANLVGLKSNAIVSFLANSVMLEFLAGIVLGLLVRQFGEDRRTILGAVAAALLLGALAWPWASGLRLAVAGPAAFATVALAILYYPRTGGPLGRWALSLGAASYALYLVHSLAMNLVKVPVRAGAEAIGLPSSLAFAVYVSVAMMFSLVLAFLLHRHFELPAQRLCRGGGWHRAQVGGHYPAATAKLRLR